MAFVCHLVFSKLANFVTIGETVTKYGDFLFF